ncbi:hypothetical protein F443_15059 [Phytophthora nicotianae P1569]|uniref:Uncharacterized protein n=1 Tax=Phytophthora nicotianae P1569 TaxID=1317065 RepID=V9EJF2_PHYNI|nr:hypothetical protein F443_15059 [Phytophthora nicotianae P1569]
MDVEEEREFLCLHDMTDFLGKNLLPAPSKAKDSMRGSEAVPELTAWIDDRFECFRSCLARGDHEEAAHIKNHFQFNHES